MENLIEITKSSGYIMIIFSFCGFLSLINRKITLSIYTSFFFILGVAYFIYLNTIGESARFLHIISYIGVLGYIFRLEHEKLSN